MCDHLGNNDASTATLDAADAKQKRNEVAHALATDAARDHVGALALMLAETIPEEYCSPVPASIVLMFERRPESRRHVPMAQVLAMSMPGYEVALRIAASDEIHRRHMASMADWINDEAELGLGAEQ